MIRLNRRAFTGILTAAGAAVAMPSRSLPKRPKYIFLLIGDGMGPAQRKMAEGFELLLNPGSKGLCINHLPVHGTTTTQNVEDKTTDSAAAGTALATGTKTVNKALGLAQDLETPLRSIAYDAQAAGMKVGLITDASVDHATPAAFYAQVKNRGQYYEIDQQLAASGFDYLAGAPLLGRKKAGNRTMPQELAREAGYLCVEQQKEFEALKPGVGKVLVEHEIPYRVEGPQALSLADMTRKGIELLDGDNGFFMMVEGGRIDWCGHANDLVSNLYETLAFNDAASAVMDFQARHPDDTLVVVTADHETGGLQFEGSELPERFLPHARAQQHQSGHYAGLFKQWKRAGNVAPETAFERLVNAFRFESLPDEKLEHLRRLVDAAMASDDETPDPALARMYGNRNPAVVGALHQMTALAQAEWKSFGHTSTPVVTTAAGPWAKLFSGETDNTDIGRQLRELILPA